MGNAKKKDEGGFSKAWKRLKEEGKSLGRAMLTSGSYANAANADAVSKENKRIKRRINYK